MEACLHPRPRLLFCDAADEFTATRRYWVTVHIVGPTITKEEEVLIVSPICAPCMDNLPRLSRRPTVKSLPFQKLGRIHTVLPPAPAPAGSTKLNGWHRSWYFLLVGGAIIGCNPEGNGSRDPTTAPRKLGVLTAHRFVKITPVPNDPLGPGS